jgi:hypothetical protein
MKTVILAELGFFFIALGASAQNIREQAPVAFIGGTLIDVSSSGHSTHDIPDSIVIVRAGKVEAAGSASSVKIPPDAKKIDCRGTFILPGLVDGFAGLNSQAQANAWLYMGVTTIVALQDDRRGMLKLDAHPSPHIYPLDLAAEIDTYSLLINLPRWKNKLKNTDDSVNLSEEDTKAQLADLARLGARAIYLGRDLKANMTQFTIAESHRLGLATYGEFASTSYADGLKAGVDVLLHMTRYPLGLIPPRLQLPLVTSPDGAPYDAARAYVLQLHPADPTIVAYGNEIKASHATLMPTLSLSYLLLPDHRNLWKEPVASILDPEGLHEPPDPATGEATETNQNQRAAEQLKFWAINRTLEATHPPYLVGSGASGLGTMPGISTHTELELLVRLGLTPREALAAATSNYCERLGWCELGLVASGRRADLLILAANPTTDITNSRKIRSVVLDGEVIDRQGLLSGVR